MPWIEDKTSQYCLIVYFWIVLLSSIIGDSIILAASISPNGIRLNRFIVTVMQHIAVSDLISCITYVSPFAVSSITNRWIIQGSLVDIRYYLDEVIYQINTMLITLLSTSKLLLLKFPNQASRWNNKRGHIACAAIWVFVNVLSAISLALPETSFYYYDCFSIVVTLVFPVLIMIVTTVLILLHLNKARKIARRSGGKTRLRGVATVVATVIIYCISTVPLTTVAIYEYFDKTTDLRYVWFIISCFSCLNIMSNIYVYYCTIPSLRDFVRVKIFRGSPSRSSRSSATGLGVGLGTFKISVIRRRLSDNIQSVWT